MKTEKLIEKLKENHQKWLENLSMEEYEKNGEEEFNIWLENKVKGLK